MEASEELGLPVESIKTALKNNKIAQEEMRSKTGLEGQLKRTQLEKMRKELREVSEGIKDKKVIKLTGSQRIAAGFAARIEEASEVIDEVGYKFTGVLSRLAGITPEGLKSTDRQRFEQAQRNFINAVLRRESGAAIAPSEFDSAELQYFPQPGNKAPVLEQKQRNREVVLASLKAEAGEAFSQLKEQLPAIQSDLSDLDFRF